MQDRPALRLVASARGGPSALLAAQSWTESTDGALASGAYPVSLKPQALRGTSIITSGE